MVAIMYPELDIPSPKRRTQQDEDEIEQRIYMYNEHQSFTSDVFKFFTYLDRNKDNYRVIPFRQCYFCRETIVGVPPHAIQTVEVPLKSINPLWGGKVFCCDEHYSLLVSPNKYPKLKCVRCEVEYLVEDEEYSSAGFERTSNHRMCPECTYRSVNEIVPYDLLLAHVDNMPIRSTPITRLVSHTCTVCKKNFVIDLCMSHTQLLKQHKSMGQIHCLTCFRLGMAKSNQNKFYVNVHSNIFVVITKVGNMWHYSIMRVINEKAEQHTRAVGHRDVGEAILMANAEAWKLFPLGKQTEVWEEP